MNGDRPSVSRVKISERLRETLESLEYVDALWEAGAAAFGRVDPWSDLDVYVVVDDARVPAVVQVIEAALESVSPIEQKYEVTHPPGAGLYQAFYRLRGANPFLIVDLAVFTRSAPDKYLEPELHGTAVFAFNKRGSVPIPHLAPEPFVKALMDRKARLEARLAMFHVFVEKELNRHNGIEAMDAYRVIVLDSLLELLRMRYQPVHYTFRARYVHYELPADVVSRFQGLCFVRDPKDLGRKYREALAWFREIAGQVDEAEVRRKVLAGRTAPDS